MKKNISILILIAIVISGSLCACQKTDDGVAAITVKEAVLKDNAMQLTLKDNESLQLTPFILPQTQKVEVSYDNLHPEWLTVSPGGLITPTAFSGGKDIYDPLSRTDTLTVKAGNAFVKYAVIITNHILRITAINLTSAGANIQLKEGGRTFDLAQCVSFTPSDAYNTVVTYTSSDENVATVSQEGIVTSVHEGSAIITISSTDGSNVSRTANVTILGEQPVSLNRDGWTATAAPALEPEGFNYVPEAIFWVPDKVAVNGVKTLIGGPECLFDDEPLTYFCLEKPGRGAYTCKPGASGWNGSNQEYGDALAALLVSVGADPEAGTSANPTSNVVNYFVVDMKQSQRFSYLIWRHRNATNNRVLTINLYGSNDESVYTGSTAEVSVKWTRLNDAPIDLSAKTNNDEQQIFITEDKQLFNYRFVKVEALTYPSSGMTFGVAEFNLGRME